MIRYLLAAFSLVAIAIPLVAAPPNIVWIWADNLAYRDLSCYGNPRIQTPVIDRLAQDGCRFTQYAIAHVVCSPSRAALLTGRQPYRCGIVDVLRPDSPIGLPHDELTIAEMLQEQGYATMAVGKWHLGDRPEYLPTRQGFDHYFGLPYSMDMLPTVLYHDETIIDRLDGDKVQSVTERMTAQAVQFVTDQQNKPFFLYFSHTLPHPPINLPSEHRHADRSAYEDAIEYLDSQVGVLLKTLDDLRLSENTLVFFSSDNGPMLRDGDTGALRGRIRDAYEGGVRVPLIARWPGHIPAGREVTEPAIAYDIFPTLMGLAGGTLPTDRVYDGQDIWPLLSGEGEFRRRSPFIWVYTDRVSAIREGRWKLHVTARNETLAEPELYDLDADPGESKPVNVDHPEVFRDLLAKVAEVEREIPKVWTLMYPVRDTEKLPSGVRRE